jgi:mannitol-specific phosphotransferase system IIBC component
MQQRVFLAIAAVISFTLSLILTLSICSPEVIMADSRGSHNNHDKNSNDSNRGSHNNHDKNSNDSNQHKLDVATLGNQNINCMGNFMNCRNEITNIICSQVTYCIIGQVSPFLMVNPTSP